MTNQHADPPSIGISTCYLCLTRIFFLARGLAPDFS
jgi:hypothetical protein